MNEVIEKLKSKGYLVSDDFIENLPENFEFDKFLFLLEKNFSSEILVLNKDILKSVLSTDKIIDLNWSAFDHSKSLMEKGKNNESYNTFKDVLIYDLDKNKKKEIDAIVNSVENDELSIEDAGELDESGVVVLKSYSEDAKKRSVEDFVSYFRKRFEGISNILRTRQEMGDVISLNRLTNKKDNERVVVIGLITEKRMTKNDNVLLKLEDFTGGVLALINKNKGEIYIEAKDMTEDEVVGIIGIKSGDFIFVDSLIFPDVPISKGVKKFSDEIYCAFISDMHVGSKEFLGESFNKFLKWINGESGNDEQKKIANKLKYLFIGGDLVDGVGIYPGQENDLEIQDIYDQYNEFTNLIKKIPSHIKIVICPGNHDALRLTEPQPAIGKEYCEKLLSMDNVFMVSNPSYVNIHATKDFDGFDVLLYHGTSFNYYLDNIESIRINGGYTRADLVMQYFLKKRHLAPTHTSTSYIPNPDADYLIIDKVPDFFLSGHIHRLSVSSYRCVSLINASCWIGQTDFQEKVGLIPQPGKVIVANLQTRQMKVLSFYENGNE